MATRKRPIDPAEEANKRVLEMRQERIEAQRQEIPDLLGMKAAEPANAAEFLRDEFDKKTFGDQMRTTTRVVYGPHPLVDQCPEFKERLQKYGKQEMAERYRRTILEKGAYSLPDAVMQKSLAGAIARFGAEAVAEAFAQKVLEIPERTVEYEIGPEEFGDPETLGDALLRDCVARYGRPGFANFFMSERVMGVLGTRGYRHVKDARGENVKAGTLFLMEIPQHIADARKAKYVRESDEALARQQEEYLDMQERITRAAGPVGKGSRPLNLRESMTAEASSNEAALGNEYQMGVEIKRQE